MLRLFPPHLLPPRSGEKCEAQLCTARWREGARATGFPKIYSTRDCPPRLPNASSINDKPRLGLPTGSLDAVPGHVSSISAPLRRLIRFKSRFSKEGRRYSPQASSMKQDANRQLALCTSLQPKWLRTMRGHRFFLFSDNARYPGVGDVWTG